MLSNTGSYALRAVIYLASQDHDRPVRVDDVAAALGVPKNYLSKILHTLVKEGILGSTRGPAGGFRMVVSPTELTLSRVLAPFDEGSEGRQCLLGRGECDESNPCAAHDRWSGVATRVDAFFNDTALQDLVADMDAPGIPPEA